MELQLKIAGALLVALALLHVVFPKYFKWKTELKTLSLVNQQIMAVHTFFIALVVLLTGLLCLSCAAELATTSLGKKLSLGLGLFWTIRLLIQFFGYSSLLWKGKTFETTVHVVFSVLWTYLSLVFFIIYFG